MILGISRTASTTRTNDRLQERLARAMAAKNLAQRADKADSPALSSGAPSRTGSPVTVNESPRTSLDLMSTEGVNKEPAATLHISTAEIPLSIQADIVTAVPKRPESMVMAQSELNEHVAKVDVEADPRPSIESIRSSVPRASIESTRQTVSVPRSSIDVVSAETADVPSSKTITEYDALLKQLRADFETAELQRQEEVHGYTERIDALQSKLQYLAKESAETAKKAGAIAASGSLEKKLAEREEQIALLMDEGQNLSKKELSYLNTIKKLRAKMQEDDKELADARRRQENAENEATLSTERWKKGELTEKRLNERLRVLPQLQKDMESLKSERDSRDATIVELRKQLKDAIAQNKQAEMNKANEALELEKIHVSELQDDLANLKIEKTLMSDRAQAQIKELREKLDKDAERARIAELEMKTEQQMLESKLEVMRARAEEVSSGATGDAQAKLLRQIETLQSQYAVASENWQGIEASLIARATNLEKERDEATRKEADVRRKAREVVCFYSEDPVQNYLLPDRLSKPNITKMSLEKRNPSYQYFS